MSRSAKRSIESLDSDCAEINFEKKPKKTTKKSKKANSDDEEFSTSSKLANTCEQKRTRKSQVHKNFNEDDEDLKLALEMSKAEAASFSTKTESETVQFILNSRSNDEILTSSKEITIASNEACQSNENTNDANPTTIAKKNKLKTPRSAAKKPKKEKKQENSDQEEYSPKDKESSNEGEFEDQNDLKSKQKKNSAKRKTEPKAASSKKKTPASKKKQKIEHELEIEPRSKIIENKENIEKKSAQQSLNFNEENVNVSVEHVDEFKIESVDEQVKTPENESFKYEKDETEEKQNISPKEITANHKVLGINHAQSNTKLINSKFNSPAIVKQAASSVYTSIATEGSLELKATPPLVRLGLSRNSKIKPLHPNAKLQIN